jgi:hypothetical protein
MKTRNSKFVTKGKASVGQTSAFEVCGSSLDSCSRTGGQATVFKIPGVCKRGAADPKDGGPSYTSSRCHFEPALKMPRRQDRNEQRRCFLCASAPGPARLMKTPDAVVSPMGARKVNQILRQPVWPLH